MCKVYNSVGSLTFVKTHLLRHNVNDFSSINELLNFQKNFPILKQQIIEAHKLIVKQEKINLDAEISLLSNSIRENKTYFENYFLKEIEELKLMADRLMSLGNKNIFQKIFRFVKQKSLKRKIDELEFNFNSRVNYSISDLVHQQQNKISRYEYIKTNFEDAVDKSSLKQLSEIDYKLSIICDINSHIYGAIGEHKVVKELEKLSDEYILINDFSLNFQRPIYNKQEGDYIKSIQADHILVAPSGIFLIETKNWNEISQNRIDLRSPVRQIRRTNYALFNLLLKGVSKSRINLRPHHWGSLKIPIRNLIVFTNTKPQNDFQYVKVLTVSELIRHIEYFQPIFCSEDVREISNYLLDLY